MLVGILVTLREQKERFKEAMEDTLENSPYRVILTVPGIGPVVGAYIVKAFDYSVTVKIIENILKGIKENKGKRVNPRFYWLIGDLVLVFLSRIDSLGYYVVDQNDTLGKSVGLSGSSIRRIIAFRRRFSDIALVDPGIAWSEYRDNKVLY